MKTVPIREVDDIGQDAFIEEHLHGLGKPLIVRNFAKCWSAGSKWSFAYFKQMYGDDFALLPSGFAWKSSGKLTKLGEFIDRIDEPLDEVPGFWLDGDMNPLKEDPQVEPGATWNIFWDGFRLHPELVGDVSPGPHFMPDFQPSLNQSTISIIEKISRTKIRAIYIGRKGTITPLHTDYYNSHGCLTQISGLKKVILFSPSDSPFIYDGKVDPLQPDYHTHPLLKSATAYEGTLTPGDFIFLPSQWWHYTKILEKSITYSYNFFNKHNLDNYLNRMLIDKDGLSLYLSSLSA